MVTQSTIEKKEKATEAKIGKAHPNTIQRTKKLRPEPWSIAVELAGTFVLWGRMRGTVANRVWPYWQDHPTGEMDASALLSLMPVDI